MATRILDFNFTFEPQADQTVLIRELNNQEFVIAPDDIPTLREDVKILGEVYIGLPRKMRHDFDDCVSTFIMLMLADAQNMQSVRDSYNHRLDGSLDENSTKH